uniref:Uncharacterized protein n=1 Tax=Panagrolaimus davidi TaxID=227884 RepID=A0A914QDN3_9BILA
MLRIFAPCKVDFQVFKEGIFEFMDNPINYFASRPEDVKGGCVFLLTIQLISLLLGHKYFGSFLVILISGVSFVLSGLTGIFSKSIKDGIVKLSFIQIISNGTARWSYIQFTISVALASFTFISVIFQIALATQYTIYLFTAIMSVMLFMLYSIEALAALRLDDGDSVERTHIHPAEEA